MAAVFDDVVALLAAQEPEGFPDRTILLDRAAALKRSFDADCRLVDEIAPLLFGDDIIAYGERASTVFHRWETQGAPGMPALVIRAAEFFGISGPDRLCALLASAILAEVPNNLQYHGNIHYRKVLFHAIRLAAVHNRLFRGMERELSSDSVAALMIAACIHDLGHEGGDNLRDGVYTPGAMELRSCGIARPYLEATGLPREMLGDIETAVFCTDITFFAGDNSPCIRMKKIYRHYLWGDIGEDVSLMMMGKLRRYEDNISLLQVAMILHEADIGSSAGLSYEQTIIETINIMEERGLKTAGPRTVLAFLRDQLGEIVFTEAARQLFGPVMSSVTAQAERDILSGRQTYYN